MPTMFALPIFVALCTWVCYLVAKKRGANVAYWVVMGVLVGPFAIPFVFFSRPKPPAVI
jgi:hypothetical protein